MALTRTTRRSPASNEAAFLDAALDADAGKRKRTDARFETDDLTVIRLDRKREAFDGVFEKLDAQRVRAYWASRVGDASQGEASEEFFSGNVASLLDAASTVSRVEIRRRSTPGRLHEEVEMFMPGVEPSEPAQ